MGYRIGASAGDGLRNTHTYNNIGILKFLLTQGFKQILPFGWILPIFHWILPGYYMYNIWLDITWLNCMHYLHQII